MTPNFAVKMTLLITFFYCSFSMAETNPYQAKKNEMWESTRKEMIEISRQLGVACTYCHNVKNYKDDSMKTFKISHDHSEMVKVLNRDFSKKVPKVDCYMCHRGQAIPDYKEKLSPF